MVLKTHIPLHFFSDPDPSLIQGLALGFMNTEGAWTDWQSFEHPQLGQVELGGLDFMMTIRNPPKDELPAEVHKSHQVADKMRRILPRVETHLMMTPLDAQIDPSPDQNTIFTSVNTENLFYLHQTQVRSQWVHWFKVNASLDFDSAAVTLVSGFQITEFNPPQWVG